MDYGILKKLLPILAIAAASTARAQTDTTAIDRLPAKASHWYERLSIRGYAQVRYNRLLETNGELKCEQCDRSIGSDGGISLRRVRVVIFGQIHERVYVYIQPDFASSVSTTALNFGQIRDAYFDVGLDKKNEYRVRLGQSKMPYGFENMQSSQNRLPLDRADATNSALVNERDIGAVFYWAPRKVRERYSMLVNDGYKGSGDFGVLGFGVYNGQGANRPDGNSSLHVVGRATYPITIGSQIVEPGIQAYSGKYTLTTDQLSTGVRYRPDRTYADSRAALTAVLYPRPFGIQAEYNIGRGPQFNPATDSIEARNLSGGYATLCYMLRFKRQFLYPFVRLQQYKGGKKHELDARSYDVKEVELGLEWQPIRNFELVAQYTISDRRFEDFRRQDNRQQGRFLRLQAQLNF